MREGQALQALQEEHGRLKQLEEQCHKLVMLVKGFHPPDAEQEGITGNFTFLKKKAYCSLVCFVRHLHRLCVALGAVPATLPRIIGL